MYTLANDQLTVTILDPVADRERFGVRYCTGGYIYQVADDPHGDLLTGPTYPDSFNWFDGQGIPDAFNLSPLRAPNSADSIALVIGIGLCDLKTNQVAEFCHWDVERGESSITMRTNHAFAPFAVALERTVSLHGRTVRSSTRLANTGSGLLPLRWFPHPFYPQPEGDELCRLNIPFRMAENAGYAVADNGFIRRKAWPDRAGFFQPLDHDAQSSLVILQKHRTLGLVAAICSYVPDFFPIWGNDRTFSWEPYYERTVFSGQETSWWIDYQF